MVLLDDYLLPDSDFGLGMAGCVTVSDGAHRARFESALRLPEAQPWGIWSLEDPRVAEGTGPSARLVQWWADGPSWVLVERNGYWGSVPESLLSAGCHDVHAVFWNVLGQMRFVALADGSVRRDFDPVFVGADPETDEPGDPGLGSAYPEEASLDFYADPLAAALALLAMRTHVDVRASTLLAPRQTWLLPV
jgi:hypothetical protein